MRRLLARNETLVGLVLAAVCLGVAWAEPSFLSLSTLFDLLRNGIVTALFAVGVLLVLASGGIDVSFTAIAAFAMYVGTKAMVAFGMGDSILVAFAGRRGDRSRARADQRILHRHPEAADADRHARNAQCVPRLPAHLRRNAADHGGADRHAHILSHHAHPADGRRRRRSSRCRSPFCWWWRLRR